MEISFVQGRLKRYLQESQHDYRKGKKKHEKSHKANVKGDPD